MTFAPGSLVRARGRDWVVLPDSADDLVVVRPVGGGDDEIAAILTSVEALAPAEFAAPDPTDAGNAVSAGLLRTALQIGFRSTAGPFRSVAGLAVEPRPYQLVPLLMALRQRTTRLLIADDVGVGKTVEAGLVAAELLAQGSARGFTVLGSPALAERWQAELAAKFRIDAELVLSSTVARLSRNLLDDQSIFERYPHTGRQVQAGAPVRLPGGGSLPDARLLHRAPAAARAPRVREGQRRSGPARRPGLGDRGDLPRPGPRHRAVQPADPGRTARYGVRDGA